MAGQSKMNNETCLFISIYSFSAHGLINTSVK